VESNFFLQGLKPKMHYITGVKNTINPIQSTKHEVALIPLVSKFHKQFNIYYLIYRSTTEAIIEQVYDQIQHV